MDCGRFIASSNTIFSVKGLECLMTWSSTRTGSANSFNPQGAEDLSLLMPVTPKEPGIKPCATRRVNGENLYREVVSTSGSTLPGYQVLQALFGKLMAWCNLQLFPEAAFCFIDIIHHLIRNTEHIPCVRVLIVCLEALMDIESRSSRIIAFQIKRAERTQCRRRPPLSL